MHLIIEGQIFENVFVADKTELVMAVLSSSVNPYSSSFFPGSRGRSNRPSRGAKATVLELCSSVKKRPLVVLGTLELISTDSSASSHLIPCFYRLAECTQARFPAPISFLSPQRHVMTACARTHLKLGTKIHLFYASISVCIYVKGWFADH